MKQEERFICFDQELQIEAYYFKGVMQRFPNHFHEYYVIGLVEGGSRHLVCKGKEFMINRGDMVLFNPGDNHACSPVDNKALDWHCINIKKDIMADLVMEICGKKSLPQFSSTVIGGSDCAGSFRELYQMILDERREFRKEELLFFLIEQLIQEHTEPVKNISVSEEILRACQYMEQNFLESITLDQLSQISGLKKYTLVRYFTKQKGVTPYQYLETIRVGEAKKLLESGTAPVDAAFQSGFSDQSHFTKFFKNFIGLTPRQYQSIFKETGKHDA